MIEVYDRNNTDKEEYIGVQELDYATIYSKPDHSVHNYWIALSNIYSETDFSSIKGYLKVSISILHDDDNRVELTPQDNDGALIAVPPHIKPNYMQLSVGVLKGEEFPDMDSLSEKKTNRSCQAFITMTYLGKTLKTQVHDMKDNLVIWNECLNLPFTYPCTSEKIIFKIYDEDLGSNDLIGAFEVNIIDIIANKYLNPVYFNVYGGPATTSGKFTDLMNENPEVGSNWKGRVLLTLKALDTTEPKMGVEKLQISTDLFEKYKRRNLWMIEYELIDALFLPWLDGKVTFAFAYEDNFIATPSRTIDKGNLFNWKLQRKMPFMHLTNKAEELGDIFIYLCKGEETGEKKRACFQRIPAVDVFNSDDILIFKLLPDPAIGSIETSKILIKMKIKLTLQEDNTGKLNINAENNLKKLKEASKVVDKIEEKVNPTTIIQPEVKVEVKVPEVVKEVKQPVKAESSDSDDLDAAILKKKKETELKNKKVEDSKTQTKVVPTGQTVPTTVVKKEEPVVIKNKGHTIVANVYMSKEFIAGDKDGTSDPFVEVTLNGVTQSTSVKNDQVNAVWNESLIFKNVDFEIDDLSTWPILYFKVLDKDTFGNDDLGYSYIWLSHSAYQINNLSKFLPKWYQFKLCLSDRPQGKLLLSFYILDYMDSSFNKLSSQLANLDISPDTKPYSFEVNVLGLRNLEPLGILPVKKPYIYFDMNSITIPNKNRDDDVQLKSVKTEALHVGPNPNINTTLQFKINLPVDDVFMPTLTCMVFDKILFGIANDTLGVFSIDINKMINETKKNLKKDLEITSKKIGISSLTKVLGKSLTDTEKMETEISLNKEQNKNYLINLEEASLKKETEPYLFPQEAIPNVEKEKEIKLGNEMNEKDSKPLEEPKLVETKRSNEKEKEKDIKSNKEKMKGYTGLVDDEDHKKTDTILEVANEIIATDGSKASENKQGLIMKKEKKAKKDEDDLLAPFVIKPEFITLELETDRKVKQIYLKEDESKRPDLNNYFELGYENPNLKDKNNKKHYRRIFHSELENVKGLDIKSPFIKIPIYRDKFIDKKEFNDVFNQLRSKKKILKRYHPKDRQANMNDTDDKSSVQEEMKKVVIPAYGHFKGLINCIDESKKQEFFNNIELIKEKNPALLRDFNHFTKYNELAKQILIKKNLVLRLYILELRNLAKKDILSESDPYVKIKLGETLIDEQKKHLDDQANAMIYRYYE